MHSRILRRCLALGLCLLLAGTGCGGASSGRETAEATPLSTEAPTPEPTAPAMPAPITVAGKTAEDGVLCAVVEAEDFALIEQIPDLRVLDVSGSDCYEAILAYRDAHPETEVRYTVTVDGTQIAHDAEEASLPAVSDPGVFRYLPALRSLTVSEPLSPETASGIRTAAPWLSLQGSVAFAGVTVSTEETEADLSEVSPALCEEVAKGIAALPALLDVNLKRADGSSEWTFDEAKRLMDVRERLRVELEVTAFDRSFSLTDDTVDFSRVHMEEREQDLLEILPYLRGVRVLNLSNTGLTDERLAELREQFSAPKIVWTVTIGKYQCRTDAIMIHMAPWEPPILKDSDTKGLIYCNEVKYLDLGHNQIQDTYFVSYMPNLEVCIIAIGQPTDISGFANCPHLEYAELFNGHITDISPLANCKELKHLNLCMNKITDITPLYGLTQLERLWISKNPIPEEQIERFRELMPDCVVNTTCEDPTLNEWRRDNSRPSGLQVRYELLRKQFQYGCFTIYLTEEPPVD
jgi:Leucine-rich repeat (LRR) protein